MSSKHTNLGKYTLTALKRHFDLVPKDLGPDAHRSRLGMTFDTKSWEIEDIGHLCVMRMNAFLGLMKMETIMIAPTHADLPLFNVDWVKAFGTETLLAELYDTQLAPWPENAQEKFEEIKATYDDIEDYSAGAHWYDSMLYSASFHKKGKGCTDRFNKAAKEYIDQFALQLSKSKKVPRRSQKCPHPYFCRNARRERRSRRQHDGKTLRRGNDEKDRSEAHVWSRMTGGGCKRPVDATD